jgi:Helix-turn-helix domain/RodZ C-terminal domain
MVDTPRITELRGYDSYEVRLGDEMRGERATMGKSLLDVQRELRIQASYISAIENCDYSVFPNKSFVAGYVRSYARYLNLDSDAIYRRFCEESEFDGVNAGLAPARMQSGGTVVPTGPVRLERNDPLFTQHRRGAAHPGGLLNTVSLAGVGSVVVLLLLIGGLGFAGWKVVQNIQRVDLSPVDQTPVLMSEVEIPGTPSDNGADTVLAASREDALIDRLIRPQTLPRPIFEPLDGPIVDIDPEKEGLVLTSRPDVLPPDLASEAVETASAGTDEPQVTERVSPPLVQVLATRAAWVRLYFTDGSVLFEKIMEKDETFDLPQDIDAPLLRAGNSGSVFLVVDGVAYGPVGNGTRVAKEVSLEVADITGKMTVADIPGLAPAVPTAENTLQHETGN